MYFFNIKADFEAQKYKLNFSPHSEIYVFSRRCLPDWCLTDFAPRSATKRQSIQNHQLHSTSQTSTNQLFISLFLVFNWTVVRLPEGAKRLQARNWQDVASYLRRIREQTAYYSEATPNHNLVKTDVSAGTIHNTLH